MRKIIFILMCVLLPSIVKAQYTSLEMPSWVKGYFEEQPNSYIEVVSATGYSEDDARNKAAQLIVERRSLATGQHTNININNGNIIIAGSDDLTVKSRIIDQYTEKIGMGEYRVSLLVQTAKNPEFQYESVMVTDRYKFSPRVFVPGMAQLHKGQTVKGALFIGTEIAAIGGIIVTESMRTSYQSKIKMTHNSSEIQSYISKADNMGNIRNCFIGAAAAIYVWNVIDGIVSKGKKHVEIGAAQMQFVPYTDVESAGLLLTLSF